MLCCVVVAALPHAIFVTPVRCPSRIHAGGHVMPCCLTSSDSSRCRESQLRQAQLCVHHTHHIHRDSPADVFEEYAC